MARGSSGTHQPATPGQERGSARSRVAPLTLRACSLTAGARRAPGVMTAATFLGTGNFLAPGRYWNGFVLDRQVLVEPSPTALPHLRRCGLTAADLDVVVISHFHPDHTFGWPFLLLEVVRGCGRCDRPFCVVGPPGVEAFLADMMALGAVTDILARPRRLDMRFIEVDGSWQDAGPLRFRAIEVEHVPDLRCFGYLLERDGTVGSATPGTSDPARGSTSWPAPRDVLVLECNGPHPPPVTHMDIDRCAALRGPVPGGAVRAHPSGRGRGAAGIPDVIVPCGLREADPLRSGRQRYAVRGSASEVWPSDVAEIPGAQPVPGRRDSGRMRSATTLMTVSTRSRRPSMTRAGLERATRR